METTNILLHKGDSRIISFPSLAMSGYLWEAEVADSGIASVEHAENKAEGNTGNGQPVAIGTSPDERFAIRGLTVGSTRVTFRQRRNWETGVAPLKPEVYDVKVEE